MREDEDAVSELEIELVRGTSVVTRNVARTPLKLLTPQNHGHSAWVFSSSYGGGFVGKDDIRLRARVGEGASLFLSSQASSKVYRETDASFELDATVESAGVLVSWPDPIVCFRGARLSQAQRFVLAETASAVVVDILTSGRMARGERWEFDSLRSRIAIDRGGIPILREALELSSRHGELGPRMEDVDAVATVVLSGPRCASLSAGIEAALREVAIAKECVFSTSRSQDAFLLRAVATDARLLTLRLRDLLGPAVAGLLGDDPLARKW